jgi:hypothetical protein
LIKRRWFVPNEVVDGKIVIARAIDAYDAARITQAQRQTPAK